MIFDNLFDFETNKIRKLFYLFQTTYTPLPIEKLTEEVGLNRKTLLIYIGKMQDLFAEYNFGDHLKIIKIGRNELYLSRKNDIYTLKFEIYYLLNTIEVRMLMMSLDKEGRSFNALAEGVGISESLLRSRIRKINGWLKKYELKLERKSYKLVGEEYQIRAFLFQFNQFFPNGVGRPKSYSHEETFLLMKELQNFFEIIANEVQQSLLFELVNLTVDRIKQGHPIDIQKNLEEYTTNSRWFDAFLTKMPVEIISQTELTYLFLIVQGKFSFLFSERKQAQMIQDHFLRKTKCFQRTELVVKRINYFFPEEKINYDEPVLVSYLSFHLYYELVYNYNFEAIDRLEELSKLYPKFMGKLEKAVADVQRRNEFFATIRKEVLVHRYFHILTTIISPLRNENKKYICLLTELPPEKEIELEQQLKNFFYNKINLQVLFGRNSQAFLYADVIIVSAICQKIIEETSRPILLIEDSQLKLKELLEIEKILK